MGSFGRPQPPPREEGHALTPCPVDTSTRREREREKADEVYGHGFNTRLLRMKDGRPQLLLLSPRVPDRRRRRGCAVGLSFYLSDLAGRPTETFGALGTWLVYRATARKVKAVREFQSLRNPPQEKEEVCTSLRSVQTEKSPRQELNARGERYSFPCSSMRPLCDEGRLRNAGACPRLS